MKSLLRPGPQAAPAAGSQGATGFSELRVLAPQPGWQREEAEGPQGSHSWLAVGFKWQSVKSVPIGPQMPPGKGLYGEGV